MVFRVQTRSLLILAAAIAVAAAAVVAMRSGGDALTRARASGVVRAGYAVEAPYAFVVDGAVTGVSSETAKLIAARLDLRIEWVQTDFGSLIGELNAGRFDVIAAGMFATPDRALRVAFSEPELRVRDGLLVAAGNPLKLRAYADLVARGGLRVAVIAGSIEEQRLQSLGVPPARLLTLPDAGLAMSAIAARAADVLALSLPSVRHWAARDPQTDAIAIDDGGAQDYVAFAFRRDETALRDAWNRALGEILGREAHLRAIAPLGFERADLPGSVTLREVLAR
jgi:polar amino acid transport system substrate-binding protein